MPKLDLNKINPVALAVLTFAVLGIAVLIAKFVFPALQQAPQVADADTAGPQLDTIQVLAGQKNQFAGYDITVPEGWNISYKLGSPVNTKWLCSQNKNCQLLVITHDSADAQLTQVVFSTPTGVTYDWTGEKKSSQITRSFAGNDVQLTIEKYKVIGIEDTASSVSEAVAQAYGCDNSFLCFDAGLLSADVTVNAAQMNELSSFLAGVKLEKL